jgi:hypothetical protein
MARAAQTIEGQKIATNWLQAELSRLSTEAEAIAVAAVTASVAPRLADLEKGLNALGEKAASAQALAQEYEHLLQRIARAHEEVAAARREISQRTGVAQDRLLKEKGWQVDNKLYHAQNRAQEAAELLGQGDLEAAQGRLGQAKKFGQQVSEVVEISLAAAQEYRTAVPALAAETQRIAALVPQHQEILAQIRAGYAAAVLNLGAGDPTHPNANGTVEDNITETEEHLKQAAGRLRDAETAFKEGRVLETAELLNQAKAQHELALHRLGEIAEKQKRLRDTEQANGQLLQQMQTKLGQYSREIQDDARTMQPTLTALKKTAAAVASAASLVQAVRGDPFTAQQELQAADSELEHVYGNMARNDRDLFTEAENGLKAAARQMVPLTNLVREATGDQVPDSKALTQAARATEQLERDLKRANHQIGERHGDWHSLGAEANRITAEASRLVALVKGEMEKAAAAVEQISRAAQQVDAAAGWSGGFGVRILGAPGDQLLDSARALLARGMYTEAQHQAESACHTAQKAIEDAEAALAAERERRRREEEEQRRRAVAAAELLRSSQQRSASSSDDNSTSWSAGSILGSGGGGGFTGSAGGSSGFGGFTSSGGGSSGW